MTRLLMALWVMLLLTSLAEAQEKYAFYKVKNVETGDHLNLRSGPGLKNPIISSIPHDADEIRVLTWAAYEEDHSWLPISWKDKKGWVNANYLQGYQKQQTSPVAVKVDRKTKETRKIKPQFNCSGTEPFWGIDIHRKHMVYQDANGLKFKAPIVFYGKATNSPSGNLVSSAVDKQHAIVLVMEKTSCSDGMSDINYHYKTTVLIDQNNALSGCCND